MCDSQVHHLISHYFRSYISHAHVGVDIELILVNIRDGQLRIHNLKDSNPKLFESKMPIQTG